MTNSQTACVLVSKSVLRRILLVAVGMFSIAASDAQAEDPIRHHAVLIGVAEYEHEQVDNLMYTIRDVKGLSAVLTSHGEFVVHELLDPQGERGGKKPTRANILDLLKDFFGGQGGELNRGFARLGPRDHVLVFFSGHGMLAGQEEAAYLCPRDFDPANPHDTGISLAWLRKKLADCPAETKLLILDSCHAGSEKDASGRKLAYEAPSAAALVESFATQAARDVVTLASCRASESSYMSDGLKHSLFSYHVIEAFKGHADFNLDGGIDIHELYGYVHERVERDAQRLFGRSQRPVRIIGGGLDGIPTICRVQPLALDALLDNMAVRLAYELYSRQEVPEGTILPLEFAVQDQAIGHQTLRLDSGALGKYCAETLRRQLKSAGERLGSDTDRKRLKIADAKLIQEVPFLDSETILEPQPRTQEILKQSDILLAVGTIRTRVGLPSDRETEIVLSCEVRSPSQYRPLAQAAGKARITVDESAMSGWSLRLPEGTAVQGPSLGERPVDLRHPLQQDPLFPFPIGLRVGNKMRPGKFVGNRLYVPVGKGEEYGIMIEHRGPREKTFMLRLLVDGQNTLPQYVAEGETEVFRAAPVVVNLQNARPWVLDPAHGPQFLVRGFVTKTGADGLWAHFQLVDRENSLAARQQYTDQIGVITAAIYQANPNVPKGALANLGTTPGRVTQADLTERRGLAVGNPVAFLSLHYIDQKTWNQLPQPPVDYMSQ